MPKGLRRERPLFHELPIGHAWPCDSIGAVIRMMISVAPATDWYFAGVGWDLGIHQLLSSGPEEHEYVRRLDAQLLPYRRRQTSGPRISATGDDLGGYCSAATMVFADEDAAYGVLTLLRGPELGSFTSGEIRALTFALDESSQTFADARISESVGRPTRVGGKIFELPSTESPRRSATEWAMYVLDADLRIVHSSAPSPAADAPPTAVDTDSTNRLPRIIEDAVRELTASWTTDPKTRLPGVARPMPFLTVSTQALVGGTDMSIGVLVQRFGTRNPLRTAVRRFSASPREAQVLALLLNGDTLNEIAAALHITSSTVQDHLKSLMQKTATHSRSEMIATILGWRTVP